LFAIVFKNYLSTYNKQNVFLFWA